MCVPRERISVSKVNTYVRSTFAHVCVLSKKHMNVFQLNTFMRVPQVNVYCFSRIRMCVPRVHTCVSELDMCV